MNRYVLANGFRLRPSFLKLVRFVTQSHYEVLGLKRDATHDDIKAAYKELSKKLHPDVNKKDPKTHDKFIQLTDAYTVLSKTISRRQYDRELEIQKQYSDQINWNVHSDFYTNRQASDFGHGYSSFEEEILKQRASTKQFTEAQTKQIKTEALGVTAALIFFGISFAFALNKMSKRKKNNTSMLSMEAFEADKIFIQELKQIDEQSTTELIEEVEEIIKALAAEES